MILVDSNILVYALNRSSPKYQKAQEFLQEHINEIVIAHQNILEAFRVLTHPKFIVQFSSEDVLQALMSVTKEARIISPKQETYYLVLHFLEKYNIEGDKIFDAYLAATALSNNIDAIATDNTKDFKKFNEIKIVNPFA